MGISLNFMTESFLKMPSQKRQSRRYSLTKTQRKYTDDEVTKINTMYWDMSLVVGKIAKEMKMGEVTIDRLIMTQEAWEEYKNG